MNRGGGWKLSEGAAIEIVECDTERGGNEGKCEEEIEIK